MIGAIIGDIVGSVYEFNNIKTKKFEFFRKDCTFTDDTVMTVAVADALMNFDHIESECLNSFKENLIESMHNIGGVYPDCGYGGNFNLWIKNRCTKPYNSYGNGSAMRVSPVGWYGSTLAETEMLARATAEVTHNHPEGIKGAVATAGAVYLARNEATKEEISDYIARYYNIDFTLEQIRPAYRFDVTCQGSVPQALRAFVESVDFEDAIRNAISIGGDSDTIAAITGSVAEAYYGIPMDMMQTALSHLDDRLADITNRFALKYIS